MGLYEDTELQIMTALANWDFTPAWPPTFGGDKSVAITPGYPSDTLDNILKTQFSQQYKRAVISVRLQDSFDSFRTLGGVLGPGAQTMTRYATRVELVYTVSAWADQQMGGPDTVRGLGSQIQGCMFYNRSRLTAIRQLETRLSGETYQDRPQMWRFDITVRGYTLVSYDT